MKNIKNILYLFILTIGFVSCENGINSSAEGTFTASKEITISFTDTNDNMDVLENGGVVTFDLALSKPLPVAGVLTLDVTSSDGSLTNGGPTEVSYTSATIAAGATTASFTLTFADDTLADNSETYTVSVGNFIPETALIDTYINVTSIAADSKRTVNVFDSLPIVVTTTVGDVDILLDWATGEDLDLYLYDPAGARIAYSWFSQPETMVLGGVLPDGNYTIGLDNWNVTTAYAVPCTFSLTFPDGHVEVLLTNFEVSNPGANMMDSYFSVDKVTDGAVVTYTISQL